MKEQKQHQQTRFVHVFYNDTPGHFSGYQPDHAVHFVVGFTVDADTDEAAMETVWAMMNRGSGREWKGMDRKGYRSMSVGDVMEVFTAADMTGATYAVAPVGFTTVDTTPSWPETEVGG